MIRISVYGLARRTYRIVLLLAMLVFPVLAYFQEGWHAVFGFFVLPALIIFGGGGLYWWFVERHHNS